MRGNFLISIKGTQKIDGKEEKSEIATVGDYIVKGNKKYIIYKECNNMMLDCDVTSVLELSNDKILSLSHRENSHSNLILERGKRHMCYYDTIAGSMLIGVFTKTMDVDLDENGGKLDVEYSLDFNCDINSEHKLSLNIKNLNRERNAQFV